MVSITISPNGSSNLFSKEASACRAMAMSVLAAPLSRSSGAASYQKKGARLMPPHLRLAEVPAGAELVYGKDQVWPVVAYRNVYILPGVPSLFRRKFIDIRDRFRAQPVTVARAYLDAEEGQIAGDLDAVVAAFPAVRIGSYPRFTERDFKVLITFEGPGAGDVAGALAMLVERIGPRVVRQEPPALAGEAG